MCVSYWEFVWVVEVCECVCVTLSLSVGVGCKAVYE